MKKAMTMPMTLVITIVVLVIVAAIVVSISSGRLNQNDKNMQTSFDKAGETLNNLIENSDSGGSTRTTSKGINFPSPAAPSPF